MNASSTPNLTLPFLQPGQALKHITHNEALQRLDSGLYLSCSDMAATDLPSSPETGQTIIMSNTAVSDHAGNIGVFNDGVWVWFTPTIGWILWDETAASLSVFDGQTWIAPIAQVQEQSHLGVNTSASASQRIAVASQTSLFTHEGSSHRMSINRADEADTASLVFQTDYQGNAELGLTGPDGFSIRTSSDGTNWSDRLATPENYSGVRAPAFGSVRVSVENDSAKIIETPATGGLIALTIVSDNGFPQIGHSGLLAYDTGGSPGLLSLAKTHRLENHGSALLDGLQSEVGNIGLSAVNGGIYLENRIANVRDFSITFLC